MCHLLTREHVFKNLNPDWQSLSGLYDLLREIEQGTVRVFAAFDDAGKPLGACWGRMMEDGLGWWNHSAFQRGVNALALSIAMAERLKTEFHARYIAASIPKNNRAANLYALRFGCRQTGNSADGKYNLYRKDL